MIKFLILFLLISSTGHSEELNLSNSICQSLGNSCSLFLDKPTGSLAESILSVNDFLLKQMVKEKTNEFYPDNKRNKKKENFGNYIGGMEGAVEKSLATTQQYFQIIEGLHLNNKLKTNLKECLEEAKSFILEQFPDRIGFLNSQIADPNSLLYQIIVDTLPLDQNIFAQLKKKEAKEKFIKYILKRDETNLFQYYCRKDQSDCPEEVRDPDHPFICWHFARYMFHKYRNDPYNYDNQIYDNHYHLKPVDEKFRIPIRETWIKYPKDGDPGHAINAVYIGEVLLKDRNSSSDNVDDYFFFEPQNDSRVFIEMKELKGTQYYLLKSGANPLTSDPVNGFNSPMVCHGWEKTNNGVKVIPLEECKEWSSLFNLNM